MKIDIFTLSIWESRYQDYYSSESMLHHGFHNGPRPIIRKPLRYFVPSSATLLSLSNQHLASAEPMEGVCDTIPEPMEVGESLDEQFLSRQFLEFHVGLNANNESMFQCDPAGHSCPQCNTMKDLAKMIRGPVSRQLFNHLVQETAHKHRHASPTPSVAPNPNPLSFGTPIHIMDVANVWNRRVSNGMRYGQWLYNQIRNLDEETASQFLCNELANKWGVEINTVLCMSFIKPNENCVWQRELLKIFTGSYFCTNYTLLRVYVSERVVDNLGHRDPVLSQPVDDYVVAYLLRFFAENYIDDIYLISGDGNMHSLTVNSQDGQTLSDIVPVASPCPALSICSAAREARDKTSTRGSRFTVVGWSGGISSEYRFGGYNYVSVVF